MDEDVIEEVEEKTKIPKLKKGLLLITNMYSNYPMTTIFVIIIAIMGLLSVVIVDSYLFYKILTGLIFSVFLFFAIESRYFNVKFENEKDARSLRLWHYLFGLTISIAFLLAFINFYTYNSTVYIRINTDGATNVLESVESIEYPNHLIQYGLVSLIVLLFLLGISRIKTNLKMSETDYLNYSYKKYIKLFMFFFIGFILSALLKKLLVQIQLTWDQASQIVRTIFNLVLPIIIYPIVLNLFTNTSKTFVRNKLLKKATIFFIAPVAILTGVGVVVYNTLIVTPNSEINESIIFSYLPHFFLIALIGVGLKIYLKEYSVVKEEIQEKKTTLKDKNVSVLSGEKVTTITMLKDEGKIVNERERKYIKIISDLILLPLVLFAIIPAVILVQAGINDVGLFSADIFVFVILLVKFLFILFYTFRNYDIAKRYISYISFLIMAGIIGYSVYKWSFIGFERLIS